MSNFRGKSFAFVTSAIVAAPASDWAGLRSDDGASVSVGRQCAGGLCREAAKDAHKKVTRSVVVLITNSRAVVLTKLEATPSDGTLPKAIVSNLAPGKKTSVKVATDKSCVFNLHGDYADGSSTDSTSVDLRDKNVNFVE
jgi:hypothetical protein